MMHTNPITGMDYPDPDVIRVEDTYYMVSTTMHFMPGCVILRSYDLIHWEIADYVYETLEDNKKHNLTGDENIYGRGMWAASLRYHNGRFYVCFVANDTRKTYLFLSENIHGPWEKKIIEGFYHDCSLLFEDNRLFIVYGNSTIYLTELNKELTGRKENGLHRILVEETNPYLGYEGAHIYKINGRYYLFLIHSEKNEWRRIEACFVADSLEGEFVGGDILKDDMGYHNQGVAQGGIVDTPEGNWYGVLFQDRGAIGRIPVLVPVHWDGCRIVMGEEGKVPLDMSIPGTRPDHEYEPLYASDDFNYKPDDRGRINLKKVWQWNHNPDRRLWSVAENPGNLRIRSGKLSVNVTQAVNTLTQRMKYPGCKAYVTVDGSGLEDGDYAGISAFQGCYGLIALTKDRGRYYLAMLAKEAGDKSLQGERKDISPGKEYARISWNSSKVMLMVSTNFEDQIDMADFYYCEADEKQDKNRLEWKKLGISHKLYFKLDHFCGCRFGLFLFSTAETGGYADFSFFHYIP